MSIKFADQKIREARQPITALDREMNALSGHARCASDDRSQDALRELWEHHSRLRQERKEAYRALLELLELDETPRDEMGKRVIALMTSSPRATCSAIGMRERLGKR
jgi:hypothetical protein